MKPTLRALAFLLPVFFIACKNETADFISAGINDYAPYAIGKSFTYRLDSTVFVNAGNKIETHKYQVKHTVTGATTDNAGNKTFIVSRLINNENATGNWQNNGNYSVTPFADRLETVENNLRIINLVTPITPGYSWYGNKYLPLSPYNTLYKMSLAGITMNQWKFSYAPLSDTTINNVPYAQVYTVVQNNFTQNIPVPSPGSVGISEVATEKYAKGVGLIFKDLQLYEHQPPNVDAPQETYIGFGIKMWLIDHN